MLGDEERPGSNPCGPLGLFVALYGGTATLQYHHDAETPESLPHDNSWCSSTVTSLQRSRRPRDLADMPQGTGLLDITQGQLERYNGGVCWESPSPRVQIKWANEKSPFILTWINSWLKNRKKRARIKYDVSWWMLPRWSHKICTGMSAFQKRQGNLDKKVKN